VDPDRQFFSERRFGLWAPALLGALIALVYGPLTWAPFIYDDSLLILRNPQVAGPWTGWQDILLATFGRSGEFEPLVVLFHRFLYGLADGSPFWYRATSLVLHWLNAWALCALFRRFLGDFRLAFLAALLFALHPAHVDALAQSVSKKHLLVTLFAVLSLLVQLRTGLRPALRAGLCWLCTALALACKETALLVPALAFLAAWAERGDARAVLREERSLLAGMVALCAGYLIFRALWVPRPAPLLEGIQFIGWLLTVMKCLLWYLGHLALPWGLCFEYTLSPITSPFSLPALGAAAGVGALAFLFRRLYRNDRVACFGLAWLVLGLVPFLATLLYPFFSLVANRYLYLASAGFALLAVRLAQKAAAGRPGGKAAILLGGIFLLALPYAAVSARRMGLFADPLAFWSETVACAPLNPRACGAFGGVLLERRLYADAVRELERAVALAPDYVEAALDLAMAYAGAGKPEKGVALLESRLKPRADSAVLINLGVLLIETGRHREALGILQQAAALEPRALDIRLNRGWCELELGMLAEAEADLSAAADAPEYRAKALHGLGRIALRRGDRETAVRRLDESFAQDPLQLDIVSELTGLHRDMGRKDRAREVLEFTSRRFERLKGDVMKVDQGSPSIREIDAILDRLRREWESL